MTRIDQSDLYRRNSAVFKNFVLYSPDPPSAFTEDLGTRLGLLQKQSTFPPAPFQEDAWPYIIYLLSISLLTLCSGDGTFWWVTPLAQPCL